VTPEQLQQYVDEAFKKREQFDVVFYPLVIILSLGAAWLFSYLRQKGKNLATKEDVAAITTTVESIKSELASKQHFSRVRYEIETKIYSQIWEKLVAFEESVQSLVVKKDQPVESPELKRCNDARNNLIDAIKNNRPFYPREIWKELIICQQLCQGLKMLKNPEFLSDPNLRKEYHELPLKIQTQLDKVEEAIRNRLSKFD
jgi:hypothetical protein